jgi:tRNA nucleotidyltransferase (CCA-adding enzyme)
MGLKPGPQFKKLLDHVLDARLNGEVKSESEERELVRRLIAPTD